MGLHGHFSNIAAGVRIESVTFCGRLRFIGCLTGDPVRCVQRPQSDGKKGLCKLVIKRAFGAGSPRRLRFIGLLLAVLIASAVSDDGTETHGKGTPPTPRHIERIL
jgi:hypothetical protein